MPTFLTLILVLAFPTLLIVAALRDCASFTIPNWISLALLAIFPVAALASGQSPATIGLALLLGVGGVLVGMGMFAAGWIGGGDAKILAASIPWLGLPATIPFVLVTAVAGGVLAVSLLWLRSGLISPLLANGPAWLTRLATRGENVPYGVAIAIGALAAFPNSEIYKAAATAF